MKIKPLFSKAFIAVKSWLHRLSFRTGVVVLLLCIPFYILSFLQMSWPVSVGMKSALFVIFFGLAKTFQYTGITILGAKGLKRLKDWFKSRSPKSSLPTDTPLD